MTVDTESEMDVKKVVLITIDKDMPTANDGMTDKEAVRVLGTQASPLVLLNHGMWADCAPQIQGLKSSTTHWWATAQTSKTV